MCLEASLANRWVVSAAACPLHTVVLPLTGWPQDGRKDSHSQDGEGQGVIKRAEEGPSLWRRGWVLHPHRSGALQACSSQQLRSLPLQSLLRLPISLTSSFSPKGLPTPLTSRHPPQSTIPPPCSAPLAPCCLEWYSALP